MTADTSFVCFFQLQTMHPWVPDVRADTRPTQRCRRSLQPLIVWTTATLFWPASPRFISGVFSLISAARRREHITLVVESVHSLPARDLQDGAACVEANPWPTECVRLHAASGCVAQWLTSFLCPALDLQLMGDQLTTKPSATGQPTRPTQPFILSRSINE